MSFTSGLLLSLLTLFCSFSFAFSHDGRSVNSPYSISQHSVNLKFVPGVTTPSSKALHQNIARSAGMVNQSSPAWNLDGSFAATVKLGNQFFYLIVDTGSSDIWVPDTFYTCLYGSIGPYSSPTSQNYCSFGYTFDRTCKAGFEVVPDSNFYITYSDGTSASGSLGTVEVGLTPQLTVPNQQVGIATLTSWNNGDNITSGVLGLAYSSLTSKYPGTNLWDDKPCPLFGTSGSTSASNRTCNQETYPALIESLFQSPNNSYDFSDNVFSLALSRDESNSYNGGSITYGGIPDLSMPAVNVSGSFVSTPIEPLLSSISQELSHYAISLDGVMLPAAGANPNNYTHNIGSKSSRVRRHEFLDQVKSRRSSANVMHPATEDAKTTQYIIDSGTTLTYLPTTLSMAFNTLFSPPAYRDFRSNNGLWTLKCDNISYIPDLGFSIGGEVFYHNPGDLVYRTKGREYDPVKGQFEEVDICLSAVQDYNQPKSGIAGVIGQSFLVNVLAVFDVGRSELGFAGRMYYDS